jgi:solute carrier family 50 protein (sugar transporter)
VLSSSNSIKIKMTDSWYNIITLYLCPSLGIVISTALYSAPAKSLAIALKRKSLGDLNPTPWAIMTGNCFGWLAYAYYTKNPFVLASNIPGLLVSFWLNAGASKLQYYAQIDNNIDDEDNNNYEAAQSSSAAIAIAADESESSQSATISVFTSQDILLLEVLSLWMTILVGVGWLGICKGNEKEVVGLLVNINLLFFYAAPLQTMTTVVKRKNSNSIHTLSMFLNITNAGFWGIYGLAINDIVIYGPNSIGLLLGIIQAILCCMYPKSSTNQIISPTIGVDDRPLLDDIDDDDQETEVEDSQVI